MSITGRFEADFDSFYYAVQRADAQLKDFASGAGRVETALNRMVDNFSGRRLIQEVTLATEAVDRIGGSSRLTSTELNALAGKAAEAVAKMKAMGVEVPPQIAAMAAQLRESKSAFGSIGDLATEIGGKVAAAFAIERVVDFALNVGKAQQQLSRLSKETQIDVEELQTLTTATAGYGLANDELAKAMFNVQQRIQGGDDSVARGLHMIGLSIDEVRDKHGKELFLEIEDGVGRLTGSLRDTAAAEIFGSKLGASMAGFAREARGAVEAADKLNSKLSKEEVEELAKYADEIERLERNLGTLKDRVLGGAAGAINAVTDAHKQGVSWWKLASDAIKDYFVVATGGVGTNLTLTIAQAAVEAENLAKQEKAAADAAASRNTELSKEAQAIQFLTSLRLDAAKQLEPYQVRGLEDLKAMGQLNQQNAAAIGVSADQFKLYTENVRQAESATKTLTAATIEQQAQVQKVRDTVEQQITQQRGTQTEIELANIKRAEDAELLSIQKRADAQRLALQTAHADSKENLDQIASSAEQATQDIRASFDRMRDGVGVDWDQIKSKSQASLDDARDRALKTLTEARSTAGVSRAEIDRLTDAYRQAAFAATAMGQQAVNANNQATTAARNHNEELIKEFDRLQRIQEIERSRGGSMEVTAANFDTYTAPQGISKSQILELLKQGFSLQNAIDIIEAQKRGAKLDLSKWPEEQRGPRVPGFAKGVQNFVGGTALVGEEGPELVDLPAGADVLPLNRSRTGLARGGIQVYSPTYVSGVFDLSSMHALSRAVDQSLMRRVTSMRLV